MTETMKIPSNCVGRPQFLMHSMHSAKGGMCPHALPGHTWCMCQIPSTRRKLKPHKPYAQAAEGRPMKAGNEGAAEPWTIGAMAMCPVEVSVRAYSWAAYGLWKVLNVYRK